MNPSYNYIDRSQFTQIINAIPSLKIRKWKDYDIQMLFKITYWCGLRMNEAVHLKAEDFDFSIWRLYLHRTKTEKQGYAPIPTPFRSEIEYYIEQKKGELFPKCNRYIVYNWCKRLGEMLHIQAWITPRSESGEETVTHGFRKSIGKDMIYGTFGEKAPLNVSMGQLRHTNPINHFKYLRIEGEGANAWWELTQDKAQES